MGSNFYKSDYSLNKHSSDIVYRSSNGIYELTEQVFLESNPDLTHEDYVFWKKWSDSNYYNEDCFENRERSVVPFDSIKDLEEISVVSVEEELFDGYELNEKIKLAKEAWKSLSDKQRRRFYLYYVVGKNTCEIAAMEGKNQKSIYECIKKARKILDKFIGK